jgi:hypothetical protein
MRAAIAAQALVALIVVYGAWRLLTWLLPAWLAAIPAFLAALIVLLMAGLAWQATSRR